MPQCQGKGPRVAWESARWGGGSRREARPSRSSSLISTFIPPHDILALSTTTLPSSQMRKLRSREERNNLSKAR